MHGGGQGRIVNRRQRTPAGTAADGGQQLRQSTPVVDAAQAAEDIALPVAGSIKSLSRYINVRINPVLYEPSTCALPFGNIWRALANIADMSSAAMDAVLQYVPVVRQLLDVNAAAVLVA